MRSSGRLLSSLQAPPAHLSKSLFVCSTCRQQFRPQTLGAVYSNCRNASGSTPFTEKIRRKIWGTDNPPGLKDPYGGEGFVEKALRERRGEETQVEQEPEAEQEPEDAVEAAAAEEYVPATTWEGLETVGSIGEWWHEESKTAVDRYDRFMSKTKLKTQDEFAAALHQTMLEISLLKELDKPLSMISDLNLYNFNEYSIISRTEINPSADRSSAVLSFPDDQAKETLLAVLQRSVKGKNDEQGAEAEQGAKVKRTPKRPAKSKSNTTISPPTNLSFLSISLEDPETKFAVFKRTAQITGYRIPDHLISSIKSVSGIFKHLLNESKPKPKKLAEVLVADEQLTSLPNVKIMSRRFTPIDKEKEIGRWKVIEEELTRRGLPVTGTLKEGVPRTQE